MHPRNPGRVAPVPTGRAGSAGPPNERHDPRAPLDAAAIESLLVMRVSEYARRHLQPELRGRGTREGSRRKDLKRERPYAARELLAVLAESLADPRVPTSGVCLLLDELKLDAMHVRGELADVDWDEVQLLETAAQGVTDSLQLRAGRARTKGDLAALLTAFLRETQVKQRCAAATRRKLEELEASPN